MFLRIVKDSFARQARRKLLTAVALALGTAVATATLSVALDVGDRLGREFRSLGANLLVTPQADTLPLEIGGVDYRPVDAGAYLQDASLGKLKTIFWRNNIIGFAPFLDVPVALLPVHASAGALLPPGASASAATAESSSTSPLISPSANRPAGRATLIGTWYNHAVQVPNGGGIFRTGLSATDPWWRVEGSWFR